MPNLSDHEQSGPHFVPDEDLNTETLDVLGSLEAAIYADPHTFKKALDRQVETPPPYGPALAVAISREVGLGFDNVTEKAIATSGAMKTLRTQRQRNKISEDQARELAEEVRRTRLHLFIEQVIAFTADTTTTLPTPRQETKHTSTINTTAV